MTTVAFLSCVKLKDDRPRQARDLYVSPWFVMARRFAERNADRWFILSAAYGLVDPERVIEPYDRTLKKMKIEERRGWAKPRARTHKTTDVRFWGAG
jgi:hypothetical protein